MPTAKKRINISLPAELDGVLEKLAIRDEMPVATKAVYLIKLAITVDEDDYFNAVAEGRDTQKAKFISHKNAWL